VAVVIKKKAICQRCGWCSESVHVDLPEISPPSGRQTKQMAKQRKNMCVRVLDRTVARNMYRVAG
jgi:hypothetical protein